MFTRKHFKDIAEILKSIEDEGDRLEIAMKFVVMFRNDNKRFQWKRFIEACGLTAKENS